MGTTDFSSVLCILSLQIPKKSNTVFEKINDFILDMLYFYKRAH